MESLILTTLIAAPWLCFFPPKGDLRSSLSTILLVHTVLTLRTAVLTRPPNIFTQLQVPLCTPTDALRNLLRDSAARSKYVEQLLTRIGSFETRTLYVRFGHYVVSTCDYCHSYNEFALYALPGFLWSYAKEAALVGLVTVSGSEREAYRKYAVAAIALGCLAEAYWLATVAIGIPKDPSTSTIMWHDDLYRFRHLAFILLPLVIHFFLPPSSSSSGPKLTPAAQRQLMSLQSLGTKLQLLELARGAIGRTSALSQAAHAFWTRDAREGEAVREDTLVQDVARKMGFGYDDIDSSDTSVKREEGDLQQDASGENPDPARLRKNARQMTRGLMSAVGLNLPTGKT